MINQIIHNNQLYAIIIKNSYSKEGIEFFTPDDFSQQLAYMNHPKGKVIDPHVHNAVKREVQFTKEVLVIKSGILRVDFYDDNQNYLESRVLNKGDIILLATGGHGFEVLQNIEMIEIKQGPYAGNLDKRRFSGVDKSQIIVKE